MIVSFDELRLAASQALAVGSVVPGIEEECGWACAWLEACSYPGLMMLFEALDETPREKRRPVYEIDALGLDLRNISCVFSAPRLVERSPAPVSSCAM